MHNVPPNLTQCGEWAISPRQADLGAPGLWFQVTEISHVNLWTTTNVHILFLLKSAYILTLLLNWELVQPLHPTIQRLPFNDWSFFL
jgi:hypothetical protein